MDAEKIISLEEAEVSVRVYNVLRRAGIKSLNELSEYTEERVNKIRNLGQRGKQEIIEKMNQYGFCLKTEERTDKRTETHACDSDRAEMHGDVISRQAAIERIRGYYVAVENENDDWFNDGLDTAVVELSNMPSAEPDATDINVGDIISRRAAIQAILDLPNCPNGDSDTYDKQCIIDTLEEVPAADVVERERK